MVKGNSYDFAKMLLGPLVNPGWLLNPFGFSTSWLFQNKLETILSEPTILLDLWRYLFDKPKLILLLFAIYSVNIDQNPDSFIQFSYFQSIPWSEIKIDSYEWCWHILISFRFSEAVELTGNLIPDF